MGMQMPGMGVYSVVVALQLILGFAKEIFIIALLFQLIRISAMFIKNHKDGNLPCKKDFHSTDVSEPVQSNKENDTEDNDTNSIQE